MIWVVFIRELLKKTRVYAQGKMINLTRKEENTFLIHDSTLLLPPRWRRRRCLSTVWIRKMRHTRQVTHTCHRLPLLLPTIADNKRFLRGRRSCRTLTLSRLDLRPENRVDVPVHRGCTADITCLAFFSRKTFLLKTRFPTALVAVPEDEKEDYTYMN